MSAFYHITQGGQPQGGPTTPLQQPVSQGVHQTNAPMGSAFQERGIDPRSSHQVPQQLPLRPGPPLGGHLPQQRPYSSLSPPQLQGLYPSAQTQERTPQSYGNIIPDEFGRLIEISDLTAATFTEERYHQYLSTPITIRFEKIEPSAKYDSAGEKVKSTWLNCTRTRLPNVDAAQAEDEIQRLNRRDNKKGLTLMKKQQSLGPNAQTQLTKAERDLSAAVQDPRFNIILKQLDWTEKSVSQRPVKGSKRHSSKKPRKERASITAYFSRCPRTNQVPSMLYRQLEREKLQAQAQSEQQRQVISALKDREQRERREHENMAEHEIRQEEAMANRVREQQMMSQQQQRTMGQQMHRNPQAPYFQDHASGPQHQPGPALNGNIQSFPSQQTGLQPQVYIQGRPLVTQQLGSVPQQHPHFQLNNGHQQQGNPQQPPNASGMAPQAFRQMSPQQGPPQNFRQMPPHPQQGIPVRGPNGEFVHQPINSNRPIISVVTEHEKRSKHRRNQSWHSSSSSNSSSDSHSIFDSDSEHSSTSTKPSSLDSASSDSPRITRAISNKPRRVHGSAGSRYTLAPVDDGLVRGRCRRPIKRRHEKAYIQTGSDRKIEVPRLAPPPRGPVADPLTQVREAYLAGHADHERLVSGVIKSDALAIKEQSSRRSSRSEVFSEADRLDTLPRKYRTGLLSRSDIQSGPQPRIFQFPRIRRVSASEVGRELDRERAQDFNGDFSPRIGISVQATGRRNDYSKDHNSQHDTRVLEDEFVARMRLSDERPRFPSSRYHVMGPHKLRDRQRQGQEDLFARDDREGLLRGIGVDDRGRLSQSPERNPFIDVPWRDSEGHFEDRAGFSQRSWL